MRTKQQSIQDRVPCASMITLSLIILFSCSQSIPAQQRDGDTTNAGSNESSSAPSGRVNFNIITLLNGEYLEAFGAGSSRGILRGHPSIPGLELGTTTADALIFSTNSTERMRILSNGFIGIGTTNPNTPFELQTADASPYSVGVASNARMRLINSNTTNNNVVEINLSTIDSSGVVATGVRFAGIFTNHTAGAGSADLAFVLRNAGNWSEVARFASGGNVGIGTTSPKTKLDIKQSEDTFVGGLHLRRSSTNDTWALATGQDNSLYMGYANDASGADAGSDFTVYPLVLTGSGKVGIGTYGPGYKLDVQGGQINTSGGLCIAGDCKTAWSQVGGGGSSPWTTSSSNIYYNNGNVGIGTIAPSSKLHIVTGTDTYTNVLNLDTGVHLGTLFGVGGTINNESVFGLSVYRAGQYFTRMYVDQFGRVSLQPNGDAHVGIGTSTPNYRLDVQGGQLNASGGLCIAGDCKTAWSQVGGGSQWTSGTNSISYSAGNVGIGTTPTPTSQYKLDVNGATNVTGNLNATGTITGGNIVAKYQDVAEWVPSSEQIPTGTVVVLDSTKSNQVISSTQAYDTRVAGVVSEQPGIALGESGAGKVLVATTGRVLVNVDASRGPIKIGDLLVTSDIPGVAMKSEAINIAGVQLHRPGTLVGKALEPLDKGQGKILVLLSLQ